jgi:hypothetical protein
MRRRCNELVCELSTDILSMLPNGVEKHEIFHCDYCYNSEFHIKVPKEVIRCKNHLKKVKCTFCNTMVCPEHKKKFNTKKSDVCNLCDYAMNL